MISRPKLWRGLLFCVAQIAASAAPMEHDLGQDLVFFRLHELPADLPSARPGRTKPCVVDIRYVAAEPAAASAFSAWIKFRATVRTPVFVLANAATSAALLQALAEFETGQGVIVIGAARGPFQPDSGVTISEEDERKAFNALEQGTPLVKLIADQPDKVRNDEASLVKEALRESPAEVGLPSRPTPRPSPPIDAALQRAVHLHRALRAWRRV